MEQRVEFGLTSKDYFTYLQIQHLFVSSPPEIHISDPVRHLFLEERAFLFFTIYFKKR